MSSHRSSSCFWSLPACILKTDVKTPRNKKQKQKTMWQIHSQIWKDCPALKKWEASAYSISSWLGDTGLHVGAEVMAALDWLPAPKRNEPQEFPASAAHFGQRPLPGPLGAKAAREKVHLFNGTVQLFGQTSHFTFLPILVIWSYQSIQSGKREVLASPQLTLLA